MLGIGGYTSDHQKVHCDGLEVTQTSDQQVDDHLGDHLCPEILQELRFSIGRRGFHTNGLALHGRSAPSNSKGMADVIALVVREPVP